jgi:hypothetical protein
MTGGEWRKLGIVLAYLTDQSSLYYAKNRELVSVITFVFFILGIHLPCFALFWFCFCLGSFYLRGFTIYESGSTFEKSFVEGD